MKRARFKDMRQQRQFFIDVKKKLGLGSKRLAEKLGLKLRGGIESYTFMRTAPPVDIIKKLEKFSGVKAEYDSVEGKVYWKRRDFIPLPPDEAEKILKFKFKKDYNFLLDLIKSRNSIKVINKKIRLKGYTFDSSKISRCIGAYRTNLLCKIVDAINVKKDDLIVPANVRRDRKTLGILFNLNHLNKMLQNKRIAVGIELQKDRRKIRIFPLSFGRNLSKQNKAIKILLTEKSGLIAGQKIELILNPALFAFEAKDSVYDIDARDMLKYALKSGFLLDNYRSTPANHKGDLSLYFKGKNIIIEITKIASYKGGYSKIGQCYIQKNAWPNSIQFLVCRESLITDGIKKPLEQLKVNLIKTDFEKGWGEKAINEITKYLQNEN